MTNTQYYRLTLWLVSCIVEFYLKCYPVVKELFIQHLSWTQSVNNKMIFHLGIFRYIKKHCAHTVLRTSVFLRRKAFSRLKLFNVTIDCKEYANLFRSAALGYSLIYEIEHEIIEFMVRYMYINLHIHKHTLIFGRLSVSLFNQCTSSFTFECYCFSFIYIQSSKP